MKTIRHLRQGELILSGFDAQSLAHPLPPTHPFYAVQQLLGYLGDDPSQVQILGEQKYSPFLRSLMQPAGGIPQWDAPAVPDVIPLVCPTQTLEARTIAIIAREAQQEQKTVCIITSDLILTRQIESELRRWDINPTISYGMPLQQTPAGIFFLLTAELLQTAKVTTLLAILKHPFCCFQKDSVSAWEKKLREKVVSRVDFNDLPVWLAKLRDCFLQAPTYPASLDTILRHHQALMAHLSGGTVEEDASTDALSDLQHMINEAAASFPSLSVQDYVSLMQTLLDEKTIPSTTESSVTILGRLEARLLRSDNVIIAGCNEGSWPPRLPSSPWLTSKQRQQLGLPSLESLVGRAAYDFCMALSAKRVFITRALSVEGAPTIPSRWLERLKALMSLRPPSLNVQPWVDWAKNLDHPATVFPLAAPKPCPPVQARPLKTSVSGVQRLTRDPYVYYAASILRLRPLPLLERPLAANDWGTLVHKAIHNFTQMGMSCTAPNAVATLTAIGAQAIESLNPQPATRHFLLQRWDKISLWLIEQWRSQPFVACWSEIEGHQALGAFQLTAIADRLELTHEGNLRVIDFKTGMVPSYRDVKQGLAPQLPLEGLLATEGAFSEVSASDTITLMYWQLSGYGDTVGDISELKEPEVLIEAAAIGTEELLIHFARPTVPYAAAPEVAFPDYEPLVRRQEWFAR
jgi:ATP-dependent helicase/nuclease subunit B